jgi:hypothetical protein
MRPPCPTFSKKKTPARMPEPGRDRRKEIVDVICLPRRVAAVTAITKRRIVTVRLARTLS